MRDTTAACLGENGSIVSTDSKDLDYIAQDAAGGAIDGAVDRRDYTLVFERTANDAKRTLAAYKVFASASDTVFGAEAPIDDLLSRESNVVVVWDDEPTDRYRD